MENGRTEMGRRGSASSRSGSASKQSWRAWGLQAAQAGLGTQPLSGLLLASCSLPDLSSPPP